MGLLRLINGACLGFESFTLRDCIVGKEGVKFTGEALCFDSEKDMLESLAKAAELFKGKVIVIRYEGPKGGPGMPEMLLSTFAIARAGLGKSARNCSN